ncbi:MAG: MATE family efflux transporter [Intestinimonas sp.]|jgi:putative MATE family efflux protein|nr:MATE family efflux transporter [Intestinimonas sp.]
MISYMKRGGAFYRNVWALMLPIILQNLITTSLGLIDTFMVGSLGEAPLAAVTLANLPVFVMELVIFGLQSGSSVLISQYWGKRDTDQINRVVGITFYVAGTIAVIFALLMFFLPVPLMRLLTNNQNLAELAAGYARIVGFSYLFNSITGVYVGAHRSMENPQLGLIIFSISMGTNTLLNWVFIFGRLGAPALGVIGAALATLISRIIEFIIMAAYALINRRFRLRFSLLLRPGSALLGSFIHFSSPVIFNETMWGLGTSLYKVIMGHMADSTEILAAYAISGNIEQICTVVIFAMAATSSIITGREIGAGHTDTVYDVCRCLAMLSFLCGVTMGVFMIVFTRAFLAPVVYPMFGLSAHASQISTMMLTFIGAILGLRAFNSTNIVGVLRGGGDVRAAMMIDLIPMWFVALPLASLFGLVLCWGIFWVYVGMIMESVTKFFMGMIRFQSRAWIHDVTIPSVTVT